jgi:putative membrane protein
MEKDSERIAEEKTENNLKDENFEKDWEFLIKAQSDVLMELELSKLAQKNANSLQLKELARTIMQDQLQVKEDLELLASKKNVTVPETPGAKYQEFIETLSRLKGRAFDLEYLKILEKDHAADLERYQKEALEGKDPEIRAFASGKVQSLTQHLDRTKAVSQTVSGK